ncbi:MAG: FtsX-like permease family protein, partial [Syntrophobacteraceae bacterium]
LFGIASSAALLCSILSFHIGFKDNLARELRATGVDFLVVARGCSYEVASLVLYGAVLPKYLEEGVLEKIRGTEGVEFAAPNLVGQLQNTANGRLDLVFGMDMSLAGRAKPEWTLTGNIPDRWDGIILGYMLAEQYKLKAGDEISYSRDDLKFRISGVLGRRNSQEDVSVFMPIETLRELLEKPGALTSIGVKVGSTSIEKARETLSLAIPGIQTVTLGQIRENVSNVASSAKAFTLTIAVIVAIICLIGVINSILITVFERQREIGMMRALGASRRDIFLCTFFETLMLILLGTCAGIFTGIVGSGPMEGIVRDMVPYVPQGKMIVFDPWLCTIIITSSLVLGVLAGFYPSWKSSRVSPMEVIKCR